MHCVSGFNHLLIDSLNPICLNSLSILTVSFSWSMRKTIFECALIWNGPVTIVQFPKSLLVTINILSNVFYTIGVLVCAISVFSIVFILSNVIPNGLFCEFTWIRKVCTSIDKVTGLCEFAFVNVLNFIFSPFHEPWDFLTVFVFALELIPVLDVHLISIPMEIVIFELSNILEPFWGVLSFWEDIVIVSSSRIWSIGVNKNTVAVCLSVCKFTNVDRTILFIKFAKSTGVVHLWL